MTREEALALASRPELMRQILKANERMLGQESADKTAAAGASAEAGAEAKARALLQQACTELRLFDRRSELSLFLDEKERLAWCSDEELAFLCLYLGAALHGREIAAQVLRERRELLTAALGAKIYRLVLNFARFAGLKAAAELNFALGPAELAAALRKEGRALLISCADSFADVRVKAYFKQRLQTEQAAPALPAAPEQVFRLCRQALLAEDLQWMQYLS